jgi:hypothetical protein
MEKVNFRVGDTVKCCLNGGKGKIVDIIHPLGTYAMYKVPDGTDHPRVGISLSSIQPNDRF